MKFKHRTSDVTAVRWTGTPESEMEIKSLGALIELQPETGHLFVSTEFGVQLAPVGFWLVNTEGRISVWDHTEFRNEFVEVWE